MSNMEDLVTYQVIFEPPALPSSVLVGMSVSNVLHIPHQRDKIEIVLDDEVVTSSDIGLGHYLVQWKRLLLI